MNAFRKNRLGMRMTAPLLALILLLRSTEGLASEAPTHNQLRFANPIDDPGFGSWEVEEILQDHVGIMWFGTASGLYQFDAYDLIKILPDAENEFDPALTGDLRVYSLLEDQHKNLWVGTDQGLIRFNQNRSITGFFRHDPDDPDSLNSNSISELCSDPQHRIWIGASGGGLHLFNPSTETFTRFDYDPKISNSSTDWRLTRICTDPNGDLWISGTSPGTLTRFTTEDQKFDQYFEHPDGILSLCVDSEGIVWFSGWGHGLKRLDPQTKEIHTYRPDSSDPSSISSDVVISIMEHNNGEIWAGTFDHGLNRFNKETERFIHERHDTDISDSLTFDSVYSMLQDTSGAVWIGFQHKGVNRHGPYESRFGRLGRDRVNRSNPAPTAVTAMAEDIQGKIWIGSRFGGLSRYDPTRRTYQTFRHDPDDAATLSSNSIRALAAAPDGSIWIGTFRGGLCRWDPESETIERFPLSPTDAKLATADAVFALTVDTDGSVWIGYETYGLERLDRKTGERFRYSNPTTNETAFWNENVWPIFQDSTDRIWLSTLREEVIRMPHGGKGVERGLTQIKKFTGTTTPAIRKFAETPDGSVWAASSFGLYRWFPHKAAPERYGEGEGLPTNMIYSIAHDGSNSLWAATDLGLIKINIETMSTESFNFGPELPFVGFTNGTALRTRSGHIYFGGNDGVLFFDPLNVVKNVEPPAVLLNELKVENGPWNRIQSSTIHSITLDYPQNSLGTRFGALDYAYPDLNQYAYRLNGLNKDWVNSGSRREAYFSAIPAGNYQLEVKVANPDGYWSKPQTVLSLAVLPPYWKTWWFKTFVVMLTVAALLLLHFTRLRDLKRRKLELETAISNKTRKLRELNENQARFFSIIAHDLQKPIAGVQPFAKILADRSELLSKREAADIAEEWYKEMTTLSGFLKDLLGWSMQQMQSNDFEPDHFSLSNCVSDAIQGAQSRANQASIELENNVPLRSKAYGDERMVATILRNLLSNAITHTPPQGLIRVWCTTTNETTTVFVKDTGKGMSPDFMKGLFIDENGENTNEETYENSTGLGLTLCAHFVRINGGKIWVESEINKGSTFGFTLPNG